MSSDQKRTDEMRKIKDEIVANKELPLYEERVRNKVFPVIGEGSHTAEIMFVGEAPGKNEAATGRPFCGAAGKILDEMLALIGLPRADVYITNIVKDRPTNNRDPLPDEIAAYAPYLDRQIEIIQPKVIATLGRFSMNYIFERYGLAHELKSISQMHGKTFNAEFKFGKVKIIPLFHPAATIYNRELRVELEKDFKVLKPSL